MTILALSALMLTSTMGAVAANGTWYGGSGVLEPSTSYDTGEYMFPTPNQKKVDKVYFNGFIINGRIPSAVVQLEGGSAELGNDIYFGAMLGFWRDCNKDGYIGDKNTPASYGNWAAGDYPADGTSVDHPVDTSICPVGSEYNQGLFINEFRWIGPNANLPEKNGCPTADGGWILFSCWYSDKGEIDDDGALVWADFGRPDDIGGRGEAILARYTLDNSSSTLDRVDRVVGASEEAGRHAPAVQEAYNDKPTFGECDSPENREFLGGPNGQCGLYPLWQAKRLVNDSDSREESATPIVAVYDTENDDDGSGSACDDTTLPEDQKMADVNPSVATNPLMDGSIAGTLVNIREGTGNLKFDGKCGSFQAPNLEHDRAITEGKDAVNADLAYQPGKEFTGLKPLGIDAVPMDGLGLTGGPNSAHDSPYGGMSGGAKWISLTHYLGSPPVDAPLWTTMYADVSPLAFERAGGGASAATGLPSGAQDAHVYGGPQCNYDFSNSDTNRQPNALGWICSFDLWEAASQADGTSEPNFLSQPYDLRDVDCYDMTLTTVQGQRVGAPSIDSEGLNGEPLRQTCGSTILD